MSLQRTLGIIKPDGIARDLLGEIFSRIEKDGLKIIGAKLLQLNQTKAEGFYAVHKGKPFFDDLVKYMGSGPVMVFVIEGENAISKWRGLMGATNPEKAEAGTIRRDFGENIERNTVHGSDAPETASFETSYFFDAKELVKR